MRSVPDRAGHPGIPAKSDLIFDVELVSVTDVPVTPARSAITGTTTPGATTGGLHIVPQNSQTRNPAATAQPGGLRIIPQNGQSTPVQPGSTPATTPAPAAPAAPAAAPVPAAPVTPAPATSK